MRDMHGCEWHGEEDLLEGALRSTMNELAEATAAADKVLVF